MTTLVKMMRRWPRPLLAVGAAAVTAALAVPAIMIASGPAVAMSGGEPVTGAGTAPWVATLAVKGTAPLLQRAGCGGALISPGRVLTAAHCVDGTDPSQLEIHVNARVLSRDSGEVREVRGISVLPGYKIIPSPVAPGNLDDASARDDLALVLLDRPVTGIPPVPIAPRRPGPGTAVSVFAHGTTGKAGAAGFRDDVLHRGNLTTLPENDCRGATPAAVDVRSAFCARDERGTGVTGCFDDSGSPVVQYAGGRAELAGVFSFGGETAGKQCGTPFPEYFADATAFRRWARWPLPALEPYPATPARVSGVASPGAVLRCASPRWSYRRGMPPRRISYGWATVTTLGDYRIPQPISGADSDRLTLKSSMAGKQVACLVTAANAAGTIQVMSALVTVTRSAAATSRH